jgi:uncharacterized protein YndB with AHSA1/START domain
MPDMLHRIGIKSSVDKVYPALSEASGLAGWWTKNVQASPKVGNINQLRFDDRGFNDIKVVELVPGRLVKWQCVDGAKEWIGTELTFDRKEANGVTAHPATRRLDALRRAVLFAQRGWEKPVEFTHYCSTQWATDLLSLKSLCETGRGTPYPDDINIA